LNETAAALIAGVPQSNKNSSRAMMIKIPRGEVAFDGQFFTPSHFISTGYFHIVVAAC
jgi:hypothetical protein